MQSRMNLKIKRRESFRPFAPAVLREAAPECFDIPDHASSPYMLFTCGVARDHRLSQQAMEDASGLGRVQQVRSPWPAITHVDYSARVQTVAADGNRLFYQLLAEFKRQTGCPMLINTSFNLRGEPIVATAEDAYRCFMATEIDLLVIGDWLFARDAQPSEVVDSVRAQTGQPELD